MEKTKNKKLLIIIIAADHGMHSVGNEGNHGDFRFEDLIVPYVMIEGGK